MKQFFNQSMHECFIFPISKGATSCYLKSKNKFHTSVVSTFLSIRVFQLFLSQLCLFYPRKHSLNRSFYYTNKVWKRFEISSPENKIPNCSNFPKFQYAWSLFSIVMLANTYQVPASLTILHIIKTNKWQRCRLNQPVQIFVEKSGNSFFINWELHYNSKPL